MVSGKPIGGGGHYRWLREAYKRFQCLSGVSLAFAVAREHMHIWVDADACPNVITDILFRAAERTRVPVTLVEMRQAFGNALDRWLASQPRPPSPAGDTA